MEPHVGIVTVEELVQGVDVVRMDRAHQLAAPFLLACSFDKAIKQSTRKSPDVLIAVVHRGEDGCRVREKFCHRAVDVLRERPPAKQLRIM